MKLSIPFTRTTRSVLFFALSGLGALLLLPAPTSAALFTYQGQLKSSGAPLNGTCDFQFGLFDSPANGAQFGTNQIANGVNVTNGLFTLQLDFGTGAFDGNPRWLDIQVRAPAGAGAFTPLTPRQPLTAAPLALSLVPGLSMTSAVQFPFQVTALATLVGNPVAVHGVADGPANLFPAVPVGVHGESHTGIGVLAASDQISGLSAYSHGPSSPAIYASNDSGGRGIEARAGAADGVYSSTTSSSGGLAALHGVNTGNGYAIVGESGNIPIFAHNTATATTAYIASPCCAADLYGDVAVHGNLSFSGNLSGGNKAGYVSDVALNAGPEPLQSGDLVVVVGVASPVLSDIPVAKVLKASRAYQDGVVGVVDQHVIPAGPNNLQYHMEPVPTGDYLNVVTLGMFRAVKADAAYGPIHAGDLLVASAHPGYAMKATDRLQSIGTAVGKALDSLDAGTGLLPVIVSLH